MAKKVAWVSVGMSVAALGLYIGRELRARYAFKRRTPYDFYRHAGDDVQEFGVGV